MTTNNNSPFGTPDDRDKAESSYWLLKIMISLALGTLVGIAMLLFAEWIIYK